MNQEDYFKLVFSIIYGDASKSNEVAQVLFKDVIACLKNDCQLFDKKKGTKDKIIACLTRATLESDEDTIQVVFKCQYGCAIVLKKERKQSPIDMYIVAPQQWSSGAHDWRKNGLDFCEPKNNRAYYLPRVAENHADLKTFAQKFKRGLSFGLNLLKTSADEEKTSFQESAKTIHQACKIAIDNADILTFFKDQPVSEKKGVDKKQDQKKVYKGQVQNIDMSKSATNTSWYVPLAVIIDLISSHFNEDCKENYEKVIISYLGNFLQKITEKKVQQRTKDSLQSQKQVANFKKCLDLIIEKYKKSISTRGPPVNMLKQFMALVRKIKQNIDKITNYGLTSQITNKEEVDGQLKFIQPKKATILKPQKLEPIEQIIKQAEINDYPLKVGRRLPFQELLQIGQKIEQKKLKQQSKWILLVEKTFFQIAESFKSKQNIIDLDIHMREIECEMGATNLCRIVQLYQKVVQKNMKHFGCGLQSQSLSHIQLIKTIAGVIAFESVKMNRQRKQSNLSNYRIPIDIGVFYEGFESNSYEARRAMKSLMTYHNHRRNRIPVFVLNGKVDSFEQYAQAVAKDTRSAYVWIDNMRRILQLEKQNIVHNVHRNDLSQRLQNAYTQLNRSSRYYSVSQLKSMNISCNLNTVQLQFNEKNPWLFAFLQNIPSDIMGMMKVLYLLQNPRKDQKQQKPNIFKEHIFAEQLSIKVFSQRHKDKQNSYNASYISTQCVSVNNSFIDTKIVFDNCSQATQLTSEKFQRYNKLFKSKEQNQLWEQKLSYLLNRPSIKSMNREHQLYAYQSLRPDGLQNEDFLAIGNVRSAKYTQLMVLCSNIIQRKIISNSYEQKCLLSQEVILHTAGQISTFDPKIEKEFKQVTKLVSQFIKVWGFTDVNFCPTLGPLFGYLERELADSQLLNKDQEQAVKGAVLKLCEKCIDEFNRGQKQLKQKPDQKIQWLQRFITMSAIVCFRQTVLSMEDQKQILILCELVFQLRTCEILSGRQEKPQGLRQFEKQLIFSVNKTIFSNIEVMSTLLETRFDHIETIIKKIDPSYPNEVLWEKVNLYAFKGKSKSSKDIYQIDLFHGKIFKNGKEISALDPQIKANKYFKEIFGEQRQFQVFQSHIPNYLRTKNTVNHYFNIPQNIGKIFLEFSKDGKQIRHIYQKAGEPQINEQIWIMVPKQRIKQSKCHIPKIFVDDHIAWYSESRKCMMFRRIKLEEIFNVGMVLHFRGEASEDMLNLQIGFYITYNGSYDNQDLDELCNKNKATSKYNEIKIRNKEEKLNEINCFKLLSRFEPVEYILELENKNGQIEYFLHRYQSKFSLNQDTRLESQSYFGYSIDGRFEEDQNSLFNKFPCLILKKHSKRPELLNSHQRICIISDGRVQIGGEIYKSRQALLHIDSYKYEIHDFYGDLRGSSRQSLFHLSAIMLSINDNIRISSIQMTPLEYSIYLLNSCVNNIPLSQRQIAKIDSMLKNKEAPESIVLMLQAIWTCSKAMVNILPFKQQNQRSHFYYLGEKLMMCRTLYQEKLLKGTLKFGERLQISLMQILGLKYARLQTQQSSSSSQSQLNESDSDFEKPEKDEGIDFWKGQKKYKGQNIQSSQIRQINSQFEQFNKFSEEIKKMWQKKIQNHHNDTNSSKFPKKIHALATKKDSNPMTKQMINDMQESYNTFSQEQKRIQQIIKGLNKQNLQYLKTLVDKCSSIATKIVQNISKKVIDKIKQKTSKLPDYITGQRPTLSYVFFTKILCEKGMIKEFLPHFQHDMENKIINIIKIWVELKTRLASFERIKQLLNAGNSGIVDYVALMREIQSPREQVRQKNYWLCYEAENKMQLWLSQLKTYQNLKNPGDFCQLNMGEGKTQVIIPMMILESTYGKCKLLPRINLLSSLIEEARGNFFRFLGVTGFQLYGFELPFTREVHLSKKTFKKSDPLSKRKILQAQQSNVPQIQDLIVTFSSKLYILMTRQSRLSQILRYYETHQIDSNVSMQECPLIPTKFKIFDIFDEIDELMNPLKSYIFSIGATVELPEEKVRLQVLRVLIETFLKKHLKNLLQNKMVISQETPELTNKFVAEGKYPPGLRLNLSKFTHQKLKDLRKSLALNTIQQLKNDYFSFFNKLDDKKKQRLVTYIINPMDANKKMPSFVRKTWRNQILILRGAIGFGIFEHCLSMRCGVDYGVPGPDHKKKIAVPYDAADIPSKTSEYQHPDLSSILSYCAYYTKGLSYKQFQQALGRLLSLSATTKEVEYKAWYISLSQQTKEKTRVKQAQQININSKALISQLYYLYRRNRRAISFWLNKCIFPSNLKQYTKSIQASAWDFADVAFSVGFSGTKDNRWLYSNMLTWKPCDTASIKGTDGKMIHLITKFTKDIKLIPETEDSQWQRFVLNALKMKVGCIIDAGALCVGKSLEKEIVPWIAAHPQFQHSLYHGISYCDEYGRWKVYDIESKISIRRGTSIPDHETFVLFDEARTRGADLKMSADVVAAISLGPKMTKDKFMQAAGRLRKLGRDQKLIIMATQQIFATLFSISDYQKVEEEIKSRSSTVQKREQLTHEILSWCCKNAIEQNQRLLVQFSNLGWDYIRSKEDKRIFIKDIRSELSAMYEHGLQKTTVAKLNEKKVQSLASKYVATSAGNEITRKLNLYGEKVVKQASTLDDVCQRQVQPEPQVQKSQQDPFSHVSPINQIPNPSSKQKIPDINVIFDKKFVLSENFINTTEENSVNILPISKDSRQLSELYFVVQSQSSLKAITLREASMYIKSHIIDEIPVENQRISFLSSLKLDDEKIKADQLQSALVSAKFVSGIENYSQEQLQHLLKIFIESGKKVQNTPQKYEKLTSSILRKKRVYYKKYFGSSLENLVITLKNEDNNGQPQQDEVQDEEVNQNEEAQYEPVDIETQDKMDEE